ncbi:7646_t:CDS:2, partial [Acaulospora colombiana]
MFRTLGTRLRTSSSARFALYGTAAAGTSLVVWRYNTYNKAHHARTGLEQHLPKSQKLEKHEPTKPSLK